MLLLLHRPFKRPSHRLRHEEDKIRCDEVDNDICSTTTETQRTLADVLVSSKSQAAISFAC